MRRTTRNWTICFTCRVCPSRRGSRSKQGQELCVLADHCELFVEGRAFEDDASRLREAVRQGWEIAAKLLVGQVESKEIRGLKLLFLADHVDPESRAFHFYLRLPNEIALDRQTPDGPRFIEWRFKPGQRMELRVPLEAWTDRIVLPVECNRRGRCRDLCLSAEWQHFSTCAGACRVP